MKTLELLLRVGTTIYVKTEDFKAKGLNYAIEEALDAGNYCGNGESYTFSELAESITAEEFHRLFGPGDVTFSLGEYPNYSNEELEELGFSKVCAMLDATVYLDRDRITPENCVDLIKNSFKEYEVPVTGGTIPADINKDSPLVMNSPKHQDAYIWVTTPKYELDGFNLSVELTKFLIRSDIEQYCNLEQAPLFVYDVTGFRLHQGLENDNWLVEDLASLEGYVATIVDCEFVVSNVEFKELKLIYKYEAK